jgi:hypothetical protein
MSDWRKGRLEECIASWPEDVVGSSVTISGCPNQYVGWIHFFSKVS